MEDQGQSRLIVAGVAHHLSKVLSVSKSMPHVTVKVIELMPFDNVPVATVQPADPKLNHGKAILYKREGKWVIIAGRETLRRAVETSEVGVSVILLSSQALKRCKVDSFVHQQSAPSTVPYSAEPRRTYNEEFANTPRFVDKRTPRAATIESNRFNDAAKSAPASTSTPSRGVAQKAPQSQTKQSDFQRHHERVQDHARANPNDPRLYRKPATIEPGQDRPMEAFAQVNKVVAEVTQRPRVNLSGEERRSPNRGLYGRNSNTRTHTTNPSGEKRPSSGDSLYGKNSRDPSR